MKTSEIKKCVSTGLTVHWKNDNYRVIYDPKTGFLIKSESNENYIGLTWQDGETLNGEESDFYVAGKTFYSQSNIGKAKYTISYHDGIQTHKDGSPFFGIAIFKNKKKLKEFTDNLILERYKESGIYS